MEAVTEIEEHVFWDYLHEKHGRCGHCGKASCSWHGFRQLPDKLPTNDVVEAMRRATKGTL